METHWNTCEPGVLSASSWLPWDQWRFCEFVWELLLLCASLSDRADRIMKDQLYKAKQMQFCDFECGTRPQHENNPCASLPTKTVTLGEWLNLSKPWLSFSLLPGERVTTQSVLRNSVSRSCVMFTTVSAQTHSESLLPLTIACFSKGTTEAKRFLTGKTKLSWFYSPSSHVSWLPRLCGLFGSFNYFIFSLNTVTHLLVTEALSTLCDIAMN